MAFIVSTEESAAKRAPSREHLVEQRAEAEEIGAMIGGPAAHLLRRHVAHRAEDDAGAGLRRRGSRRLADADSLRVDQLGQAEVEDLDAAVIGEEDVVGLEVAVNDPLVVRRGEPVRDLSRVIDRLARRQRRAIHRAP